MLQSWHFDSLRTQLQDTLRELEANRPGLHSPEWFLQRYLRQVLKRTDDPVSPGRLEGSIRSLVRFYVDNLDERADTGRACVRICELYRAALRDARTRPELMP